MPITIALCDDDSGQIHFLRNILSAWSENKPFAVDIKEYESGEGFLFSYENEPCDLLLLDIEMKGINGMELAKMLRSKGDVLPTIFITGYSEYISQGYDVEALHYLIKPIDRIKLFAVLDKYISRYNAKSEDIIITTDSGITRVSLDSITYVEAFGRQAQLHTSDGSIFNCNMSISFFEEKGDLIHCHRSYLVNLRHVKSISRETVTIDSGNEIPLSRRLYHDVNKKFIEYYTAR